MNAVAEFFAALGVKIEGEKELEAFDKSLQSVAASATAAVAALRELSNIKLPATVTTKIVTAKAETSEREKIIDRDRTEARQAKSWEAEQRDMLARQTAYENQYAEAYKPTQKTDAEKRREIVERNKNAMREAAAWEAAQKDMLARQAAYERQYSEAYKPALVKADPKQKPANQTEAAKVKELIARDRITIKQQAAWDAEQKAMMARQAAYENQYAGQYAYPSKEPEKEDSGKEKMPNEATQGLKGLALLAKQFIGIAAVGVALRKLVTTLMDMIRSSRLATQAIDKTTTQTGLNQKELKKWERIGNMAGIPGADTQGTMKALQQRGIHAAYTGEGYTPFGQLGIDPHASGPEIMRQFAERTAQMDQATAVYFGNLLGISEDWVYALRKYGSEIEKADPRTFLSDEEQAGVVELNRAWQEMTFNASLLADKLVSDLAPALKVVVDVISSVEKFFAGNPNRRTQFADAMQTSIFPNTYSLLRLITPNAGKTAAPANTTTINNQVDMHVDGTRDTLVPIDTANRTLKRTFSQTYYGRAPAMP